MFKWIKLGIVVLIFLLATNQALAATSLTVSLNVGDTVLTLSGYIIPNVQVTIMENEAVVGTTTSDGQGYFTKSLYYADEGIRQISLYAVDSQGTTTPAVSYSISTSKGSETTISNIALPPTIYLSVSNVTQGDRVSIYGYTTPVATVSIFITGTETSTYMVSTNSDGYYSYDLDTNSLTAGSYTIAAKVSTSQGGQSENSQSLGLIVGSTSSSSNSSSNSQSSTTTSTSTNPTISNANTSNSNQISPTQPCLADFLVVFDANHNCQIDPDELYNLIKSWVTDWRLFLSGITGNIQNCDIDSDGICNLRDFSVLLYHIKQ
ncbi:MAG: hypothetical protein M1607_01025 [Patescibacteria group bacterium]|nr:hypothetical protein [Patescibacteria group bacterium]